MTFGKFIEKTKAVHQNEYEYFEDSFKDRTKIKIKCKKHGIFEQHTISHLNGCGCPVCYKERKKELENIKKTPIKLKDFLISLNMEENALFESNINKEHICLFIKHRMVDKHNRLSSNVCYNKWLIDNNYKKELILIYSLTKFAEEVNLITRCKYILNNNVAKYVCCVCSKEIDGYNNEKYCSVECRQKTFKEKVFCKICGKETYGPRHEYCSRVCLNLDLEVVKIRSENSYKGILANNNGIHTSTTEKTKNKIKETNILKYGVKHYSELIGIHSKIKKFQQYKPTFNLDNIPTKENRLWECLKCGKMVYENQKSHHNSLIRCFNCYPKFETKAEIELADYINSFNFEVVRNDRKLISPLELDIYVPEKKLAIEYNGIYWHSASCKSEEDKQYHLNKTKLCKEQNIDLLHIWDVEWNNPIKQKIWKSIIKTKLGFNNKIYARKTEVSVINDISLVRKFLNENHLQGFVGSEIKIGLYYENELVSLATFKKPSYNKSYDYEISRYANKIGISVIGGFSKIIKFFERNFKWDKLITYADKRYSEGNVYKQYGFNELADTQVNYFYFKPSENKLYPRIKFQKHKLKDLLETFDSDLSESNNMYNNGYHRIWDCGNKSLVYQKPNCTLL